MECQYLQLVHIGSGGGVGCLLAEQLLVFDSQLVVLLVGLVHVCYRHTLRELLLKTAQLEQHCFLHVHEYQYINY